MPKISIIMPVYNGMPYLPLAVESIFKQNLPDWELIIVADICHDGSIEYLQQIAQNNPKIRLIIPDQRIGVIQAQNLALGIAKSEYITWQMADDISLPNRFEKLYNLLQNNSKNIFASASIQYINDKSEPLDNGWIMPNSDDQDKLKCECELFLNFTMISALWRNGIIHNWRFAIDTANDYDLILRMLPFGNFITTQEILLYFRQHQGSATTANFENAYLGECLSVLSYHHRQQGYGDFIHDNTPHISDWQVLFDNIKNDYHAQLIGFKIQDGINKNKIIKPESLAIIAKNHHKISPRIIIHQGFQKIGNYQHI